jgi:hypothetical protein
MAIIAYKVPLGNSRLSLKGEFYDFFNPQKFGFSWRFCIEQNPTYA